MLDLRQKLNDSTDTGFGIIEKTLKFLTGFVVGLLVGAIGMFVLLAELGMIAGKM